MAALKQLYRNLNNGKFSLRHRGIVIDHPEAVIMKDTVFKISKAGQARVRAKQVKNVHAYIGSHDVHVVEPGRVDVTGMKEVYYCPYQCDSFVIKETGEPIFEAAMLVGLNNKIYIP